MARKGRNAGKGGKSLAGEKLKNGKLKYRSFSALLLVLILLALIALNIGVQALEKKKGWRIDFSFNAVTSQSPETVEILKALKEPVRIYALFRKGDEDAPLLELLDRYAAASALVSWEQVDPALNPALLKRFTTDSVTPGSDSLIVFCEATGRFRVLGPEDYVSLGMNMETGEYTYTGWTYERSITGAIVYVTKDRVPQAVIIQGHGEMDGDTLSAFEGLLKANQYEVAYADLGDANYTPSPEDLLIFFSPLRDLTDAEMAKISAFTANGGSLLFTCDYSDPIADMPNYSSLLRSYGFLPRDGIVIADASDANSYYNGNQLWLLPEMCSTDLTLDLVGSGANHLLLPGARAFEEPEEGDRNLMMMTVLKSGETSYLRSLETENSDMARAEGDAGGPFPLALETRRITSSGYISRAFIIGCSAALADRQVYSMTDSQQLIIRVMEFLLNMDATDLSIMAKDAIRPSLGTASAGLGSVLLAALPLSVLLAALLVLGPRRNR